jgi:hemerythrin-like metal-binding protein
MSNINWSDELSISNFKIDEQHRKLIDIANNLLQAIHKNAPKKEFSTILHGLREYTVFHFNDEEEYMKSIGYPYLNQHVDEHMQIKKKVKDFQHSVFVGDYIDKNLIREMLKSWLIDHILNCDLKIKEYINSKESEKNSNTGK